MTNIISVVCQIPEMGEFQSPGSGNARRFVQASPVGTDPDVPFVILEHRLYIVKTQAARIVPIVPILDNLFCFSIKNV